MAPIPVWSGNLRLSLVLVPVRLYPATSREGTIAFRMIHEPSGKPIKYLKGVETDQGFKEVSEEEIIKGYEHTKEHHVLIKPEEIDELKLEAKHHRHGEVCRSGPNGQALFREALLPSSRW